MGHAALVRRALGRDEEGIAVGIAEAAADVDFLRRRLHNRGRFGGVAVFFGESRQNSSRSGLPALGRISGGPAVQPSALRTFAALNRALAGPMFDWRNGKPWAASPLSAAARAPGVCGCTASGVDCGCNPPSTHAAAGEGCARVCYGAQRRISARRRLRACSLAPRGQQPQRIPNGDAGGSSPQRALRLPAACVHRLGSGGEAVHRPASKDSAAHIPGERPRCCPPRAS